MFAVEPKEVDVGRMQRDKGQTFERLIAGRFRERGIPARRGLGQARDAGEIPDVDVDGLWPECKHEIRTNPRGALKQAREASAKHESKRTPVAITRDNNGPILVTCDLDHYLDLLAASRVWAPKP